MINKPYIEFGLLCLGLLFLVTTVHAADKIDSPENLRHMDGYTVVGGKSFLSGYEPITAEGDVNVVIEIPAGTTAKWEVQKPSGHLAWEFENNKPREVNYLS